MVDNDCHVTMLAAVCVCCIISEFEKMSIVNQHLTQTPLDERDLASTPWGLVTQVSQALHWQIVLDVCALPMSKRAPFYFGERDFNDPYQVGVDMFEQDWYSTVARLVVGNGALIDPMRPVCAFMNPPFSCFAESFEKAVSEADKGLNIITLCIQNESAEWWKEYVRKHATFIVKPPKRTQFVKPDGSPFMSVDKKTGKLKESSVGFYSVLPIFTPIKLPCGPVDIYL